MFKTFSRWLRNRPDPFNRMFRWASGHGPKRWRQLAAWTAKRAEKARKRHAWKRARWWVAKWTVYRRRLRRARKKKGAPKWEPWMANGSDARVNAKVKAFCARAVVKYDLTVTSMARTFVPAGGSTTSYHLLSVNNPARAADVAGARMSAFQHDEFKRGVGKDHVLELFGPINDEWVKNGQRTGGAEGSPLEQLHDSHCHGAFS